MAAARNLRTVAGMSTHVHALRGFRASLLRFAADSAQAVFDQDGLLVVGPGATGTQQVLAAGPYADVAQLYPGLAMEHLPGRIIAPGFVDMHIHYPQTDVIGAPAEGLLPWLENYTFPHEKRFFAADYAADVASFFIAELLRNGVTTALTFATSHPISVSALFSFALSTARSPPRCWLIPRSTKR